MKYHHISFDFDGVICNTVTLKKSIFKQVLLDNNFDENNFILHLNESAGLDRYSRFDYIISKLKSNLPNRYLVETMVNDFKILYKEALSKETLEPDYHLHHLLKLLKKEGIFISCISASPHTELTSLIDRIELNKYFDYISGGPPSKLDRFKKLLNTKDISNSNTLYIGDSKSDFDLSKELNIKFIACAIYNSMDEDWMNNIPIINNWNSLSEILLA
jgi:phosphoglycolate phosphatase-like HAD superfamily hydrolase